MLLDTEHSDLLVPILMAGDNGSVGSSAFLRDALQAIRDGQSEIRQSQRELDVKIDRMREERKADIHASEQRTGSLIAATRADLKLLEKQVKPLLDYAANWKRRYRDAVAIIGTIIAAYGLFTGWIQNAVASILRTLTP